MVVKKGGNVREGARVHVTRLRETNDEVNEKENGDSDTDWEMMLVQREERRERKDEVEEKVKLEERYKVVHKKCPTEGDQSGEKNREGNK